MKSKFERLLNKGCKFLTRGHDFVEIGGIKWATCNVGAEKPIDSGLYFAWGETKGYTADDVRKGRKQFITNGYKFKGNIKYNETDGKMKLDPIDDPVHMNWGGRWRLPTFEELMILKKNTESFFIKNFNGSGVNGLYVTDAKDFNKGLFFPAAGYVCGSDNVDEVGYYGLYWNASLKNELAFCGASLRFYDGRTDWDDGYNRSFGFNVRGILDI